MNIADLVNTNEVTIVDVRTNEEFEIESVEGSLNIPLNEVPKRVDEIKKLQPIVMCCAAGVRSGQAVNYLNQMGLKEVYNAGSWQEVSTMLK